MYIYLYYSNITFQFVFFDTFQRRPEISFNFFVIHQMLSMRSRFNLGTIETYSPQGNIVVVVKPVARVPQIWIISNQIFMQPFQNWFAGTILRVRRASFERDWVPSTRQLFCLWIISITPRLIASDVFGEKKFGLLTCRWWEFWGETS